MYLREKLTVLPFKSGTSGFEARLLTIRPWYSILTCFFIGFSLFLFLGFHSCYSFIICTLPIAYLFWEDVDGKWRLTKCAHNFTWKAWRENTTLQDITSTLYSTQIIINLM
jgi:hypothetical protein